MGNVREATKLYQRELIEEIRKNELEILKMESAKLRRALRSRKKDKVLSREEVMKMLGTKEYWLNEDEQKIIDEYRKQKSWKKQNWEP